ncbi:MAG: glyoxalase/bleomycin resistance protein/dioxygenase [Ilumatobacteraceae bacterium]|nr:glyoxalase/bleomycin resistance protein/dioxygenase [Ilumatobacteraceae bacterium]
MEIRALGYLGISSPNAAKWATWGPEIMGFGTNDPMPAVSAVTNDDIDDDGTVYLRMDDRRWRIAVHPGEREGELAYVGWELADRSEFFEALDELKNKGVEFEVADEALSFKRNVQGMAWFFDPAGFRHEIFYSPYYFEDSFVSGRTPMKGFRTGRLGIGHVVLMVPHLTDELDEFATRILGMRVFAGGTSIPLKGGDGGRVRTEMYRGRHNLRSHNLVYMEKAGYFGLHHIFIEYEHLDCLGRTYDLVQKKSEYPLIMTLGRHQADTFLSFYCETPSKFVFEVSWNSMLMDDESFVQDRPLHSFVWGLDMVGNIMLDHLKLSPE